MTHLSELDLSHLAAQRPRYGHFLRNFFTYLFFLLLAGGAVFYSLGYNLNPLTGSIEQTGIIEIDTRVAGLKADVYLNGKKEGTAFPYRYSQVFPGTYSLVLERDGYQTWYRSVRVEPNRVSGFPYTVLVLDQPREIAGERLGAYSVDLAPDDKGLEIRRNNELWVNGSLAVRSSEDILAARWFPDHRHIAYQRGTELVLCELDGFATQRLMVSDRKLPLTFSFADGGRVLVYKQGDITKALELYDRF